MPSSDLHLFSQREKDIPYFHTTVIKMKVSSVPVIRTTPDQQPSILHSPLVTNSHISCCECRRYVLWNDAHPLTPGGGCQGDGPKPTEQDPVGGLRPPPAVWLPVPPCVQHSPLRDTARPLHEASGEQGPVPGPLHDLPGVLHHEAQQHHRDDGKQSFHFVLPEAIMVHSPWSSTALLKWW